MFGFLLNSCRGTSATIGLLALLLGGCASDNSFTHTHHNKEEIQHLYDSGQINQYEYEQSMKEINPSWVPTDPPAPDKQFNAFGKNTPYEQTVP
jgi:hypothetical protein